MENAWPVVARDENAPRAMREWARKLEAKPKYVVSASRRDFPAAGIDAAAVPELPHVWSARDLQYETAAVHGGAAVVGGPRSSRRRSCGSTHARAPSSGVWRSRGW